MKLLIKLPTRNRPGIFERVLDEYDRLSTTTPYYLISADTDDESMNNGPMRESLGSRTRAGNTTVRFGHSRNKIHAVNRDFDAVAHMPWEVALLASDDMIPLIPGYDQVILNDAARLMPHSDGVLWYPDGRRNDLITLAVVGRAWYERKRYLYHPEFVSLWADNFMHWEAEREGKLHKLDRILIYHAWQDLTGHDDLHKVNSTDSVFEQDRRTFERLKAEALIGDPANFGQLEVV